MRVELDLMRLPIGAVASILENGNPEAQKNTSRHWIDSVKSGLVECLPAADDRQIAGAADLLRATHPGGCRVPAMARKLSEPQSKDALNAFFHASGHAWIEKAPLCWPASLNPLDPIVKVVCLFCEEHGRLAA
jgi:hypothetical protein